MTKRAWGWPVGITALLTVFVGGNLFMMHVAGSDPAFAVEPDYYRKAVAFDSTMEVERRSLALGWHARARIETAGAGHTVIVSLSDANAQPVTGAAVVVQARFNARANDIVTDTLTETSAGEYSAPLQAGHAGEWEIRTDVRRGAERFIASVRTDVRVTRAAGPAP